MAEVTEILEGVVGTIELEQEDHGISVLHCSVGYRHNAEDVIITRLRLEMADVTARELYDQLKKHFEPPEVKN